MCGRFALYSAPELLRRLAGIKRGAGLDFAPRYNIAPGTPILNVQQRTGERSLEAYRWGLVPRWARPGAPARAPINARAETAASNGLFKAAFLARRSAVPADGFYEWQSGSGGKQPYYVRRRDGEPMLLAGLYERAADSSLSCAIITTAATGMMRPLHERMPAVLDPRLLNDWLDPQAAPERLLAMLAPVADDLLEAWPVSTEVNKPAKDDPGLLRPDAGKARAQTTLF